MFGWRRSAGLISFGARFKGYFWNFHFIVQRSHWQWGYVRDWYDGPLYSFGLGPLFLLAWVDNFPVIELQITTTYIVVKPKPKKKKVNWLVEGF